MGLFRGIRKVAGKVVDVRVDKWMSFNTLKENTGKTTDMVKGVFTPEKATRKETFSQAMARLRLTEKDLAEREKEFMHLFLFFLGLGLCVIAYAVYMAIVGKFMIAFIAICIALYTFSQAFRFHFWLFQLKNRKLGCTLKEWFHSQIDKSSTTTPTVHKKGRKK